jgi:hypothetical protein
MKPTTALAWASCGAVTILLLAEAWWTWAERSDPVRYWRNALENGDPAVRREAAHLLGRRKSREVVPDLIGALDDPDDDVRSFAIQGLVWSPAPARGGHEPAVVAALMDRARDDVAPRIRVRAIDVLMAMAPDDPEARALVRSRLDDAGEDEFVRAAAFAALGEAWQASEEGLGYCSHPSPALRLEALRGAVARRERRYPWGACPPADPYCRIAERALSDPDHRARGMGLQLLPRAPGKATEPWRRAIPAVVALLSDPDRLAREQAGLGAWALAHGTEHAPRVVAALEALLSDPDPKVRSWVGWVLRNFREGAIMDLPALARSGWGGRLAELDPEGPHGRHALGILAGWLAHHPPLQ